MDIDTAKRVLLRKSLSDVAYEVVDSFYESIPDDLAEDRKSLGFADDFYSLLKAYETRPPTKEDEAAGAVPDAAHFEKKRAGGKRDRIPAGGKEAAAASMSDEQAKASEEHSKVYWHQSDKIKPGEKQGGGPKAGADNAGRKIGSGAKVTESIMEPEKKTEVPKPAESNAPDSGEDREGREIEADVKREAAGRKIKADYKDPDKLADLPGHMLSKEQRALAHKKMQEDSEKRKAKRTEERHELLKKLPSETRQAMIEEKKKWVGKRREQKAKQAEQDKPAMQKFKERREGLTSASSNQGRMLDEAS